MYFNILKALSRDRVEKEIGCFLADKRGEIAHAELAVRKRVKDPHPGGVAERVEKVRQRHESLDRLHFPPNLRDPLPVHANKLAGILGADIFLI